MVCVAPRDWMSDTGGPEDDPFDGPEGDEYSKGGKPKKKKANKGEKTGGGNSNGSGEAKRKARCKACKKSADNARRRRERPW
jgi:hypothetical protein